MRLSDYLIAAATLLGPIFAVQAQKWIERGRERAGQRSRIFYVLMTTRASRLSKEHVQALNSIDLYFGERKQFSRWKQSKNDRIVTDAWKSYIDKLNDKVPNIDNIVAINKWVSDKDQLFTEMLFVMSEANGYRFSKNQIERSAYSPKAHSDLEANQLAINSELLKLLSGQSALKMDVVKFPVSQEALDAQIGLQKAMRQAVSTDGKLRVAVTRSKENGSTDNA